MACQRRSLPSSSRHDRPGRSCPDYGPLTENPSATKCAREKATAPACRSDVVTQAFHDVATFLSSARRPPVSFVLISVGSLEPPYEGHCVKPVTRECDSATRIRGTGKKDANENNATRPRPEK